MCRVSNGFYNAGAVLFGIKEYVPALMQYVEKYAAHLHFNHRLTRVDGAAQPTGTASPATMAATQVRRCRTRISTLCSQARRPALAPSQPVTNTQQIGNGRMGTREIP